MKRVAIAAVTLSIPALVAAACSSFDAAPADSADSGPDGGTLTDGAPGPDGGLLLDAAPVGARSIRCNGNADCQGAAVCCVLNGSPEDRCVPSGKD